MHLLKSLAAALSMYSRIPVPAVEWKPENIRYVMCFFPAVGVIVGSLQFLAGWLLLTATDCGNLLFAAVLTGLPVLVTGGIHLDGFADVSDGLASWGDREKKLEIMQDSHMGAFAAIKLCCLFLFTAAFWSEVPAGKDSLATLASGFWMYVLSRALSGISVVTFPPAKKDGLLRTFQDTAHKRRVRTVLLIWTAVCAAGMCLWDPVRGCGMLAAAGLVFCYYFRISKKQFGGTTGDLAGYFLELCELAMLAALVLTDGSLWR